MDQTTSENAFINWLVDFTHILVKVFLISLTKGLLVSELRKYPKCAPFILFSDGSTRSHSMNNLLDPIEDYGIQPAATPTRRASVDIGPISPLPEKKLQPAIETKHGQTKSYAEHTPAPPPPPPPSSLNIRRDSVDLRPVSPLPDRKGDTVSDVQVPGRQTWDRMWRIACFHQMFIKVHQMFIMNSNSLFLDIVPPGTTWKSTIPKVNIGFVFPALFYRFISIIWQTICLEVWNLV